MVYQILAERPNTLLVFENNKLKTYSKDMLQATECNRLVSSINKRLRMDVTTPYS